MDERYSAVLDAVRAMLADETGPEMGADAGAMINQSVVVIGDKPAALLAQLLLPPPPKKAQAATAR